MIITIDIIVITTTIIAILLFLLLMKQDNIWRLLSPEDAARDRRERTCNMSRILVSTLKLATYERQESSSLQDIVDPYSSSEVQIRNTRRPPSPEDAARLVDVWPAAEV